MSEPIAMDWPALTGAFDGRAERMTHVLRVVLDGQASVRGLEACLSIEERQRADRYLQAADRLRFVVGRLALRAVLSRWTGEPGTSLVFTADALGKLSLAPHPQLRFNLSHSGQVVLLAWGNADATGGALGVDVEQLRPLRDLAALARMSLSPAVCRDILALSSSDQPTAFFSQWVVQEALLKARGTGLAGLDALRAASPNHPGWTVTALQPSPGHVAAVALQRARAPLRLWSASPAMLADQICSSVSIS